jgi:hypothetical protein
MYHFWYSRRRSVLEKVRRRGASGDESANSDGDARGLAARRTALRMAKCLCKGDEDFEGGALWRCSS